MRLTKHGKERIEERIGLRGGLADKVALRALAEGVSHGDTVGSLKKYLDSLFFKNRSANNMRVFMEKVFIFNGETLITVLPLPHKYKKVINKMKDVDG